MKKLSKAKQLVADDKIFKVTDTDKNAYYLCIGSRGVVYDVIYSKVFDLWNCNCKNLRLTTCYHIEAAQYLQEIEVENEIYKVIDKSGNLDSRSSYSSNIAN